MCPALPLEPKKVVGVTSRFHSLTLDPYLALRLPYTPGELHDSIVLPDKPAKDAVTVASSAAGPPCTPQVAKPLLLTVMAADGDENVQFAEDNTVMVPSLKVPMAWS
jgi:hypothetical protein